MRELVRPVSVRGKIRLTFCFLNQFLTLIIDPHFLINYVAVFNGIRAVYTASIYMYHLVYR